MMEKREQEKCRVKVGDSSRKQGGGVLLETQKVVSCLWCCKRKGVLACFVDERRGKGVCNYISSDTHGETHYVFETSTCSWSCLPLAIHILLTCLLLSSPTHLPCATPFSAQFTTFISSAPSISNTTSATATLIRGYGFVASMLNSFFTTSPRMVSTSARPL